MKLTKVFLVAEVDNSGEIRQVVLTREENELLIKMIQSGVFCKEIKLKPDVIAEVVRKDKDV